ncbi:MAG: PspC domain-containing protein [Chloroflexi bacterium OHK40]
MQPRLSRSATEKMVAGVCGGLAEYFNIDPVIVRLIFVLVTLTSGLGLPVYLLLWIVMPKSAGVPGSQTLEQSARQFGQEVSEFGRGLSQEAARLSREVLVGQREQGASQARRGGVDTQMPPAEHRFDPETGQPLGPEQPALGQTINLTPPQADLPVAYPQPATPRRARSWSTLGAILIGIGGLILLEQLGIDMSLIFPVLLIIAGVILLRRKR